MEIIHIPQVFTLWTNRVETKGTKRCGGKLIALTRYNKSLLLPRWGLKLDTIPLWCFCGQKIQNHVPSLVKISPTGRELILKNQCFVFFCWSLASSTQNYVGQAVNLCTQTLDAAQPLMISSLHSPLYLDYFGAEYTRTLICHSDSPQVGPDVIWLGPALAKENINCLNKFYRGKIIWMYRQYIEYHGMTRCEVDIKKNNAD